MIKGFYGMSKDNYKKAKQEIATIYGKTKKKKKKKEEAPEEKYIKRYRVLVDFCVLEQDRPHLYKMNYFCKHEEALAKINGLFRIYEKAVEEGRVIYIEKLFVETRYIPI